MRAVAAALARAWPYLFNARVLLLVALPLAFALVLWGALAWVFWDDWARHLGALLRLDAAGAFLARFELHWLATGSIHLVLAVLMVPATLFTALFLIAVVAMPVLVKVVAERDFPALERRHGGTNLGSVGNALLSFAVYLMLWVLTLPLWLIPPLGVVIPLLLTAWLNQRLFRYDALAEHASAEERDRIVHRHKGKLYLLAVLLAALQFVPVLNLIAPIYAAIAFIHLCLAELAMLRGSRTVSAKLP